MSAKQAFKDKLQGSVAAYLRYAEVVNNQIKTGLLVSLWVKKIKIGASKNMIVSCIFFVF